ncbi:integron assette [Trichoderma arundinaceum]|uniref:Integron assette n=1 Tax=Trichoderma arundinaceum TaxID=490622 RepID=A0A395NR14_TRIAR|nr:integron assette [Trichoderma arundinaceum]
MSNPPPFPYASPDWSRDDPSHPGFLVHGPDTAGGNKAYFIHLEAKEGKEDLVAQFLQDINNGVNEEPGTGPWFGLRYSKTTFLIFEAFPDSEARHDHDAGPGGQNFLRVERLKEMLAYPANIYRLDVLHGKFGTILGKKVAPAS